MINPYESPKVVDSSRTKPLRPRPWPTILYGIGGAFLGYVCIITFANLEDRPFYTIRSFVTGETAPVLIMEHPADAWVINGLMFAFILGGAAAGLWLARRHTAAKEVPARKKIEKS